MLEDGVRGERKEGILGDGIRQLSGRVGRLGRGERRGLRREEKRKVGEGLGK
jgi:hypothetical protein